MSRPYSDDHIKPDRMISRFVQSATGRSLFIDKSQAALAGACELLQQDHPPLTPRLLDHLIWNYQRTQ